MGEPREESCDLLSSLGSDCNRAISVRTSEVGGSFRKPIWGCWDTCVALVTLLTVGASSSCGVLLRGKVSVFRKTSSTREGSST